jgi:glycosyltransferase involved in cell wall biosynthesis
LVARGHVVESWCPPTADQEFLSIGEIVREHIVPLEMIERASWKAVPARLKGAGSLTPAKLEALDIHSQRCAKEISEGRFDVVLATSSRLFAVTSLAEHLRVPKALYLHEPYRPLYEALPRLPWPALDKAEGSRLLAVRNRLHDAVEVHGLRLQAREELAGVRAYDLVLTNSYFSRENMLRSYGIDATVCYLGVDTDRYRDQGLARKRMVVGVGAFIPGKRLDVIIEAVAQLGPAPPDLVWIGNAEDPGYLKEVSELARRRKVPFTPLRDISHDQVVRVLNEAAVLAYAPRLEPFGYPPLEAAACGLPVVARAEGGVRETVVDGETGLVVDSDRQLPSALQQILDDSELARRFGAAGRRRAESVWSLPASMDRLESHLFELVDAISGAQI